MNQVREQTTSSSIFKLIGIVFIITQTLFLVLGLTFNIVLKTLALICDLLFAIYHVMSGYLWIVLFFGICVFLHLQRIKMDKLFGSLLEPFIAKYSKCSECQQLACNSNCKNCHRTYHIECVTVCNDPNCTQNLFVENPQNLFAFLLSNKKYVGYASIPFIIIGLYPTFRDGYNLLFQASDM